MFCREASDPARTLRLLLSRIRRRLGSTLLLTDGSLVRFNPAAAQVDCLVFEKILAGEPTVGSLSRLQEVVESYRGDFLEGMALADAPEFELWLLGERARLRRLYERGLDEIISRLTDRQQYRQATTYARRLVQSNSLLEVGHARLIWLYARTDQRQAALDQYDSYRALLQQELAVEPTPELKQLHQEVLTGRLQPVLRQIRPPAALDLRRSTDFVGREPELARLRSLWQQASGAQGQIVLLEAAAGGGKTRLVQEFQQTIPRARYLYSECHELSSTLPYHPWIDLLESHISHLPDESLHTLPDYWLDYLLRLLPSLAGRLGRQLPPPPPTTGGELERLFSAVSHLLFTVPNLPPLFIVLDNLQWADEISLRLFHFIARKLSSIRTMLLGILRVEEIEIYPALQTLLDDLYRLPAVHRLRLPPLSSAAIEQLTGQLWPDLAEGFRPHICKMLFQTTGGNPLFVTEVLRELTHTRQPPAELPVPDSVRDLISRRLRRLPDSARQVIEAIAVLDAPVRPQTACQLSARSEQETITAFELGLRNNFLQPVTAEAQPTRYAFSHDLVREAVIGQLTPIRRQRLHRRAAALLAEQAAPLAPARQQELAGQIVRHAIQGEDLRRVVEWVPPAAQQALHLYAYDDGLALYQTGLRALEQLELDPAARVEPGERLTLLLGQANMLYRLGRWDELEASFDIIEVLISPQLSLEQQALFYLDRGRYFHNFNRFEEARNEIQQAYDLYQQLGDRARLADCLRVLGLIELSCGQARTGYNLLEEALGIYGETGSWREENLCTNSLAYCAMDMGEIELALQHLGRIRTITRQRGDRQGLAHACYICTVAWNFYCHPEMTRSFAGQTRQLYGELGNETMAARAIMFIGYTYFLEEDWAKAESLYREAVEKAKRFNDLWHEAWVSQVFGRLALIQGDLTGAGHWLTHAYEMRREKGEHQNRISDLAWMGRLRLAEGRPQAAHDYTQEALAQLDALGDQVRVFEAHDVYMAHAEGLAQLGRLPEAASAVRQAHASLASFASQIPDPDVKVIFLTSLLNRRITRARESGQVFPYHSSSLL